MMRWFFRVFRNGSDSILRGSALFLGGYAILSLLLSRLGPAAYDANIWWVDLRALPGALRPWVLLVFAGALLHRACWPDTRPLFARYRMGVLGLLVVVLSANTLAAWMSHASLGVPVPLTAVLAALVGFMMRTPARQPEGSFAVKSRRGAGVVMAGGLIAGVAALAQMVWFGETDYRRPADAIVVYGCKAYPDGRPSQALADRVHTACELYHQGLAPTIVMSGGPVRNAGINEPQVMADYAESLGVPRSAIVFDPGGLNTQATAANLPGVLGERGDNEPLRILAVSHDYHLPRVKLSLERQGVTAYTVPCKIRRSMPGKPYFIARETAAWWVYFFRLDA